MSEIDKAAGRGLTAVQNDAIISKLPPNDPEKHEVNALCKVIKVQVLVTLICCAAIYVWQANPQMVLAMLCGGMISWCNTGLLAWRINKSSAQKNLDAHLQLRLLYYYAAERFFAVAVLLAVCILILKLSPLVLMGGFMIVQVVMVAARLVLSRFEITEIVNKNG